MEKIKTFFISIILFLPISSYCQGVLFVSDHCTIVNADKSISESTEENYFIVDKNQMEFTFIVNREKQMTFKITNIEEKIIENSKIFYYYFTDEYGFDFAWIDTERKKISFSNRNDKGGFIFNIRSFKAIDEDSINKLLKSEAQENLDNAKEKESNRIKEEETNLAEKQQEEKLADNILTGKEMYYSGDYEGAVLEFEKAGESKISEFRTEFIKSYINIAKDFFSKGKYNESKETYIKANEISDNPNQFNDNINQCNIEIAKQLELKADNLFKERNFDEALALYNQVKDYTNDKDIEIDKKIAKCYEKKGDSLSNNKKFTEALKSYQTSFGVYNNIYVSSKIKNTQSELKTLEELKYKIEISLSLISTFNNKSSSNFQEVYGNSIGFDANGSYRINKYLSVGLGYNSSTYKNKSGVKLLNSLGIDTVGVIIDNDVAINEDRDLTISSYYLNTEIGYFIGTINPYLDLQISRNNTQILSIQYLEEAPGTGGGYYERELFVNSTITGYSVGGGVRVGEKRWRINLSVLRTSMNANKLVKDFSNLRLQLGVMVIF